MSTGGSIQCSSCSRQFLWKPQLAGKKVKCKCGAAILFPATAPPPAKAPAQPAKQKEEKEWNPFAEIGAPPADNGMQLEEEDSGRDLFGDLEAPQRPTLQRCPKCNQPSNGRELHCSKCGFLLVKQDGTRATREDRPAHIGPPSPGKHHKRREHHEDGPEPWWKRAGPLPGIPPRVGFGLAALGITMVLGAMVAVVLPIVLARFGVGGVRGLDQMMVRYGKMITLAILIGPFLCIAAPVNWSTRLLAILTCVLILLPYPLMRANPTMGTVYFIYGMYLAIPLVFFGFLAKLGTFFGSDALAMNSVFMGLCLYGTGGILYWVLSGNAPRIIFLLHILSWACVIMLAIFCLLALRAIAAVLIAAVRPGR